jgi:ABC-type transport system substrate-binding protein
MTNALNSRLSRRSVLEGMGVGALGLAGAALLGCGGGGDGGGTADQGGRGPSVQGATSGGGLPMTAPKVAGNLKRGGTWQTASTSTQKQYDPHTALAGNIWHVIGEKGLEPDPVTGAIRPHVFTSWEVADPQGLTLTFKLNPKLFIHNKPPWNGRQFTAEDAAWNLERIGALYADRLKIPKGSFQRASMVEGITRAEAIDPLTLKVTLSKPNSAFFNGLMENRVPFAPKEMDDVGWTDPLKMAGIGAFESSEWVNDQKVVYKANQRYKEFRANEPYFDDYRITVIPDAAGTQAAFLSGQIQSYSTPTPDVIATVRKAKPDANLYTWVDSNWQHIRPSVTYAPFADFRVRKALFLAMDYKAMADGYYGDGWGYQASLSPIFPEAWKPEKVKTIPGYNPDTKEQDRTEAKRLMDAAGYPNGRGLDFEIIFQAPSEVNSANATRAQNQLTTLFTEMKMRLRPYPDSASFSVPQAEGKFQILAYTITSSPDAAIEFQSQYHTNGSRNYGKFSDKNLDAITDKALTELNKEARTKLLEEMQQRFIDEWMPMYVLYAQPVKTMVQGNVGGYDTTAGPWFGYSGSTKVCRWFYVEK